MAQEKGEEKDPLQAAKEAEAKILKLQGDVQHLKQRIQLSESEEKAEIEESNKKIKENDDLIKKLRKQIQDLQISRTKGLKGDEKIIAKAFSQHSRDVGLFAGKSGKESVQILDGQVLDVIKKSNALTHELKMKEIELARLKEHAKDIAWNMYSEFEVERAETETLQRIRELENDYQKVEKNLIECQIIQSKYKVIQEQLRRELFEYPVLLEELEEKYHDQQADLDKLVASEVKAHQRREIARKELSEVEAEALKARQEKERIVNDYNKALKPRQITTEMHTLELRESETAEEWRKLRVEQEAELESLNKSFDKIKEAIGISDINDAEARFLSQKETKEELSELVKNAEERLQDLKDEAEDLRNKNEGLRGAELASPQVVLEKELEQAKLEQETEVRRRAAAEAELERIKKLHADIKSGLWQQLQLMEKYLEEGDEGISTTPDEEATVIVGKIERLLERVFEKLKDHDLEDLKAKLKEEQFMQKIESQKYMPSAGVSRKLKPTEEEESSDDEDFEKKRTQLKQEAQIYAEMKKKQQGRGRMMML